MALSWTSCLCIQSETWWGREGFGKMAMVKRVWKYRWVFGPKQDSEDFPVNRDHGLPFTIPPLPHPLWTPIKHLPVGLIINTVISLPNKPKTHVTGIWQYWYKWDRRFWCYLIATTEHVSVNTGANYPALHTHMWNRGLDHNTWDLNWPFETT